MTLDIVERWMRWAGAAAALACLMIALAGIARGLRRPRGRTTGLARRVLQLPVDHRPRRHGASKYGIRNRMFSSFQDLLAVRWMKKRRLGYEVVRNDP